MDLYRFIDSHDIREHLRSIDYRLATHEAAFVVWYCHSASLDEKFAAWKHIIATMPNCSLERRFGQMQIPDFHAFLQAHMDHQARELKRFVQPGNCMFQCSFSMNNERLGGYEGRLFSTYEQCRANALEEIRQGKKIGNYTGLRITKRLIDTDDDSLHEPSCRLTIDGAIADVEVYDDFDRDEFDIAHAFDSMWIDLPTPFHAGDIVHSVEHPNEPIVLTRLCTWNGERLEEELPDSELIHHSRANEDRNLEHYRANGDLSDMWGMGYKLSGYVGDTFPKVWCDDDVTYLDLELHREPLEADNRILQPISAYLKRDIEAELLINAWWTIVKQVEYDNALRGLRPGYLPETLESCGIPTAEKEDARR